MQTKSTLIINLNFSIMRKKSDFFLLNLYEYEDYKRVFLLLTCNKKCKKIWTT